MLIRFAVPADAADLGTLYNQLVSDSAVRVSPEVISSLAAQRAALFVCEMDNRVVATVLVQLCADVMYAEQPFAVVENLVVDAGYRRSGICAALLVAVEKFCIEADCTKIMLMSSLHRGEAHLAFEKAGYSGNLKRGFVRYRRQFDPHINAAGRD
jgi:predicted N-acetyltransferase YhbS